ncbi:MBL fold metallo-hydrolase [Nocardiopsis suaedae]|uniref:MBL fold metallo-hydrolase n=1 Tax=Nocardiopsis suaedae TaxID=3018444 RepID=A0ABT4TLU1_9ACTN|nr:MBL fold metallo-hydrolase [Nocardiopsis suaedae]MDA2805667.1 MBL fold metallo-hydrolase [Nocardiopsis suaedae]
MLILGFPAGEFGTNTRVVAPGPGADCLLVDPGKEAFAGLADLIGRHRLDPAAVVLTHGHMDHTWDAVPVAGHYGVPVYVHAADRFMVGAPARGLPSDFPAHLLDGHPGTEPVDLREFHGDRNSLRVGRLAVEALHTGGHTPGSVLVHVRDDGTGETALFTGDALLRGELGRTDGPGGDGRRLRASLARHCAGLPDDTPVLPGHGGATTLGGERLVHPWLAAASAP